MPELRLSKEEIYGTAEVVRDTFLDHPSPKFQSLARQTAEHVRDGKWHANFTPAVMYLTDTILATLTTPHIAARMSLEVSQRAAHAQEVSDAHAEVAVKSGFFVTLYEQNEHLAPLLKDPALLEHLKDTGRLARIGGQAFAESSVVMGGAARVLKRTRPGIPAAGIIAHSTGLILTAGADKKGAHTALTHIGIPYGRPQHYELKGEDDDTVVDFTKTTREYIRPLLVAGRGCPVRNMTSVDPTYGTILQEKWAAIAHVLVPSNATTYGQRGLRGRKPK